MPKGPGPKWPIFTFSLFTLTHLKLTELPNLGYYVTRYGKVKIFMCRPRHLTQVDRAP